MTQRQAKSVSVVPSPEAVPWVSARCDDRRLDEQVTVRRSVLLTLAAIDGQRNVEAVSGSREMVRTLEDLVTLVERELIGIAEPSRSGPPLISLQTRLTPGPSPASLPSMAGYIQMLKACGLERAERSLTRAAAQLAATARNVVSGASRR